MPYMLYDILELPSVKEYKLDVFTKFMTSGRHIPDVIFDGILKTLPKSSMVVTYGATETYVVFGQFHDVTQEVNADQMGTIGYPLPGFEIKITDDNDQLVPEGKPENIKVKTTQMFSLLATSMTIIKQMKK